MPVIIRLFNYKIYFWVNEGRPLEPIHVHVSERPHKDATKIWILSNGKIQIANNKSQISNKDLSEITKTIELYSDKIKKAWLDLFNEITYYDESEKQKG